MVTTVKIHKNTKSSLDKIKASGESYDDVISRLVAVKLNEGLKKRLIEGYKNSKKRDLDVVKEWESSSNEV